MFEPGQLIVHFLPNISNSEKQKIHSIVGAKVLEEIAQYNVDVVSVPHGEEEKYKQKYLNHKEVILVELNQEVFPDSESSDSSDCESSDYEPNDTFYETRQWGLRRVNPEPAWDFTHNIRQEKRIAILDFGIDPTHPDLASKIIFPANFTSEPDYRDLNGHGTHVAGIAAAVTDNATGVAGMSFNSASIIPVKVLGAGSSIVGIVQGIIWAMDHGANVINMSLRQGAGYNQLMQNAINYSLRVQSRQIHLIFYFQISN